MTLKKAIAAGLFALVTIAAAAPASAHGVSVRIGIGGGSYAYDDGYRYYWQRPRSQYRRGDYGTLTPREVRAVLRDRGYREIRYVDRRGRIYEVRATDARGQRVGLVVSARNGAILNAFRL